MRDRAIAGAAFALLLLAGVCGGAHAQQPAGQGQASNPAGWEFNVAPYLWLPSVDVTLKYHLPPSLGGRLRTEVSNGPSDYLAHLDFATMIAADVRKGPYSLLTDLIYTRFSTSGSRIESLDFFGLPSRPISRSLQTSTSATLGSTIWTLAGGYTLLRGDWGNLDAIAGFRFLSVNARTDFSLAFTVAGPRGNGATFGGVGGVSGGQSIWNGIGGVRGQIRLGASRFFIPYYVDVGTGGSQLTWQVASGLGYQTPRVALSAVYRYLSFEQGSASVVRHMTLGGPMLMADFRF